MGNGTWPWIAKRSELRSFALSIKFCRAETAEARAVNIYTIRAPIEIGNQLLRFSLMIYAIQIHFNRDIKCGSIALEIAPARSSNYLITHTLSGSLMPPLVIT